MCVACYAPRVRLSQRPATSKNCRPFKRHPWVLIDFAQRVRVFWHRPVHHILSDVELGAKRHDSDRDVAVPTNLLDEARVVPKSVQRSFSAYKRRNGVHRVSRMFPLALENGEVGALITHERMSIGVASVPFRSSNAPLYLLRLGLKPAFSQAWQNSIRNNN